MPPNISVREWIRWLPDSENEPTSTLVLTSEQGRFVDIRILRPSHGSDIIATPNDVLPSSRLDWAFAGTSTSKADRDSDGKEVVRSVWKHWVDNRLMDAGSVKDEGTMYPHGTGRTLEKGSMINPATGKFTDYEEMWMDVEPAATTHASNGETETKKANVVLMLEDDQRQTRGMVVRVGQYCQGVLRAGKDLSLERWEWAENGEGWTRQARMGGHLLPCNAAVDEGQLKVGKEVQSGDLVWKVIELNYS